MKEFDVLTRKKLLITTSKLIILLFFIVLIAGGIGSYSFNIIEFWKGIFLHRTENWEILFNIRLPRILLALCVGGGLSLSGLCLQVLLKNPLAEPYTLGLSGGATLGATIATLINFSTPLYSISAHTFFALVGCMAVISLLYIFMQNITSHFSYQLLMFGIILNAVASAIIMFLYSLFSSSQLYTAVYWMMGHIPIVSYTEIIIVALFVVTGFILLYRESIAINALMLGEENAESLGIRSVHIKNKLFLISGIVTAIAVSFTGMIGFIGLIIPHMCRLIWGTDNRITIVTSFLFGGITVLLADTIARIILSPKELPVGVITALIGGPYFIYLLKRQMVRG